MAKKSRRNNTLWCPCAHSRCLPRCSFYGRHTKHFSHPFVLARVRKRFQQLCCITHGSIRFSPASSSIRHAGTLFSASRTSSLLASQSPLTCRSQAAIASETWVRHEAFCLVGSMQHAFCPSLYYTLYASRLLPNDEERHITTPSRFPLDKNICSILH